jgi:protein subunit release factor B
MKYATNQESLEKDTELEFFRGSGPGGQHRNKRETGVRLRHIPSGLVVEADGERLQARNREVAFERLQKRLEKLNKPRKKRIATNTPKKVKRLRLLQKRKHARKKEQRKPPSVEV